MPAPAPDRVHMTREVTEMWSWLQSHRLQNYLSAKSCFSSALEYWFEGFPLAPDIKGVETKQGCVDWVNTIFPFYHL